MHPNTLTPAIYSEFGRTPLSTTCRHLSTSFFSHLASMPEDRVARHALQEALSLKASGTATGLGACRQHLATVGTSGSTIGELATLQLRTGKAAALERWAAVNWPTLIADKLPLPERDLETNYKPPLRTSKGSSVSRVTCGACLQGGRYH